jgi:integrase
MVKSAPRSWHDRWSALDRHVLARLGDRPIDSIRRLDLHEVLDELADKPGARHHALSALGQLFAWAADREIIGSNPAVRLPRPKIGVRSRALSDDEIPIVWAVADVVGYPFGPLVKLLLLTGCRRGEIAGLQESDIDLSACVITVPATRYKTGRDLVMPINALARPLIAELPSFVAGPYVFSTTGGARPISGFSKMMRRFEATLAKQCEAEGVAPFTFGLHDLRRTTRTGLSALRVAPHIAESVLGHVVTGVQKHYDRWTYITEKREALELWAQKLKTLVAPGNNVVPFSTAS